MSLPSTDELKDLRENITPGPWKVSCGGVFASDGKENASLDPDGYIFTAESGYLIGEATDADAALTALAPALLDELIRRREEAGE